MRSIVSCGDIDVFKSDSKEFVLQGNTVDVWEFGTEPGYLAADYYSILSKAERTRSMHLHHVNDREIYITSHVLLRLVLGRYIDCDPSQIAFSFEANGKPFLPLHADTNLHFNLSHSSGRGIIALARSPVGADIEQIKRTFQFEDVVDHSFSTSERKWVNDAEDPRMAFYTLWTRKEALLKGTGKGIADDLTALSCLNGANTLYADSVASTDNWVVGSGVLHNEYAFSIAHRGGDIVFRDALAFLSAGVTL